VWETTRVPHTGRAHQPEPASGLLRQQPRRLQSLPIHQILLPLARLDLHHRGLVGAARLLHAQQPHKVDPQQAADEGVGGAHDEGEDGAELVVALEDGLNAALLHHAGQDLGVGVGWVG